jgi:hypothetical protein
VKGISEEALRTLVREVVARELGAAPAAVPRAATVVAHASHRQFAVLRVPDGDGSCLIEPAVSCTHCGYCQSYGH